MTHAELTWAAVLAVLALAAFIWIIASASRTARCVLGVRRWNSRLSHRLEGVERDIAMAAAAAAEQQRRGQALEEQAAERTAQLDLVEKRLEALRAAGAPEYRLLTERASDNDRLFLFAVAKGDAQRPERWATPAPNSREAARALAAALGPGVTIKLEGKL